LPSTILAMGMGNIKIDSSLNQPFNAEIPLIDVDNIPFDGIKVGIASQESFDRAGVKQSDILSLLRFRIKKNIKNEPVISIVSEARITDPYLELVIDLAWSKGQLYRLYTVLLDPPSYNVATHHITKPSERLNHPIYHQAGIIDKPAYTKPTQPSNEVSQHNHLVYGPTHANENIWQISQRYVTADTTLPQVILAIIGTNSQAFTQGNINGLKIGEYLRIPSNQEIAKLPVELAKQEVDAHDTAWRLQKAIIHQLLPPYINGLEGQSQFSNTNYASSLNLNSSVKNNKLIKTETLLPLPESTLVTHENNEAETLLLNQESSSISPIQQSVIQPIGSQFSYLYPVKIVKQSEKDITSTVIDTIKSEDNHIVEQKKYQKLQQKIMEQSQLLLSLRQKIESMNHLKISDKSISSDKNTPIPKYKKYSLLWLYGLTMAIGMIVIGGFGFWRWLVMKNAQALENKNPLMPIPTPSLDATTNLSSNTYSSLSDTDDHVITKKTAASALSNEGNLSSNEFKFKADDTAKITPTRRKQ
jgi:pilus assembly protein FimV